jgi:hypothetical protein
MALSMHGGLSHTVPRISTAMNCQPSATSASGNGTHDHTPLRPSVRYPNLSPSPAAENGGSILDLGEVGPVWYLFDRSSLSHSVWRST